jgi:hypothetical protein
MTIIRAAIVSSLIYHILAVTVIPLTLNLPRPYESDAKPVRNDSDLLYKLDPGFAARKGSTNVVLGSNYGVAGRLRPDMNWTDNIYEGQDSFVRGAIDASSKHQHLTLRPDDVWYTALTQLSFYLRKHKNDKLIQDIWNSFEGKAPPRNNEWVLISSTMDQWTNSRFKERDRTNWLLDWVRPEFDELLPKRKFGTQSAGDEMMADAIFMSSSNPSFEEIAPFPCQNGIPSVTLLGTKADWIKLANKFIQLEQGVLGNEPRLYSLGLRPILNRFITTFDIPNDPTIRIFWNDMVTISLRQRLCETTDIVSGWINAFHLWDATGKPLSPGFTLTQTVGNSTVQSGEETVHLDNLIYPGRKIQDLPTAYSEVASCMGGDHVSELHTKTKVGMLAKSITKGIPEGYQKAMRLAGFVLPPTVADSDHSILQAEPVWLLHAALGEVSPLSSLLHFR